MAGSAGSARPAPGPGWSTPSLATSYRSWHNWDTIESPLAPELIDALLTWAYQQPDFQADLREAFPVDEGIPPANLPDPASVRDIVVQWINGDSFADIASANGRTVDRVLRIYGSVISYSLATLVEQAVAVLQRHLAASDLVLAEAVTMLPEYLRFGVGPQLHAP